MSGVLEVCENPRQVRGSLLATEAGSGVFVDQAAVFSLARMYRTYLARTVERCNQLVTNKAKELWELFKKRLTKEPALLELYPDLHRTCKVGQKFVREAFLGLVKDCDVVVYSKPMDSLICRIIGKLCCTSVLGTSSSCLPFFTDLNNFYFYFIFLPWNNGPQQFLFIYFCRGNLFR